MTVVLPGEDAAEHPTLVPGAGSATTARPDVRMAARIVVALSGTVALAGLVPALILAQVPDTGRSEAWLLTIALTCWSGIRLSLVVASGVQRLFDLFFWVFCYTFMGLAPSVQIRSGLLSTTTDDIDPGLDVPTALTVWVGVLCYEIGRLVAAAVNHRRPPYRVTGPPYRVTGPASREGSGVGGLRTLVLLVVALGASAYFLSKVGVAAATGSREAAFAARQVAWPDAAMRSIFYAGAVYPLLVAIGALAQMWRNGREAFTRRVCLVVLLVSAVVLLAIVNPIASARYTFGTVVFALAVYAGAAATRQRARVLMIGTIIGLLFVFPLADTFRRAGSSATRAGFLDEYMSNPDYDAFWQIANAYAYWQEGFVVPLRQITGSLFFWLPRSIWSDKPTDTGIMLAEYRGYSFDNLSAPLWAEFLVNGGPVAVVLGFVLVGAVLHRLDRMIVPAFGRGGLGAIVGAILPVYMTILLRGSLLQATGTLAVTVVSILVLQRTARTPDLAGALTAYDDQPRDRSPDR
ncbi:hypothetical protein [Microlunatus sp. Y2014]|uniref:hypothetical protein n=1 Tax=Microlunatus sp. Y2014 TaxID=3418488 RepID=UPI003DA727FF